MNPWKLQKRAVAPALLMMALVAIVIVSCKKKDTEYPPVTPQPEATAQPAVFSNGRPHIVTAYELSHQMEFPAHILCRTGTAMLGDEVPGIGESIKGIGEVLWDVTEFQRTEDDFATVDTALAKIQGQITLLQAQIVDLGAQLSIDFSDLEHKTTQGAMNTYFANINGVMDASTHNGLRYYSSEGAKYQAGTISAAQIKNDSAMARAFALKVFSGISAFNVCDWSKQINVLLCPPGGSSQDNSLQLYANLIVQKANPGHYSDSANIMKLYSVLESYFLQAVNNQFQCATVWSNACNFFDTTGYQGKLYYTGTFATQITQEVQAFLDATDYLLVNLADYRSQSRFIRDMQYADAGLAPDIVFPHVMARSQYIANLLYAALGKQYPRVCGYILLPAKYGSDAGQSPATLTVNVDGSAPIVSTASNVASQFPYTWWSNSWCLPDNNWKIYRFGTLGEPGSDAGTDSLKIQLADNGSNFSPWLHTVPVSGYVTMRYYDPAHPNNCAKVKTPDCIFQFGYFADSWPWGYLWFSNQQMNGSLNHPPPYYDFAIPAWSVTGKATIPFTGISNCPKSTFIYEATTDVTFSYPNNNSATMVASGTHRSCPYDFFIADGFVSAVCSASTNLPPIPSASGSDLEAWAICSGHLQTPDANNSALYINIGTQLHSQSYKTSEGDMKYYVLGDIISGVFQIESGISNVGPVFGSKSLIPGTSYAGAGVEYCYRDFHQLTAGPISVQVNYNCQFVYQGLYALP